MKRSDWLYLIEFFTKRGDLEEAEKLVKIMHSEAKPSPVEEKLRARIEAQGFKSYYL